ncbi:hypothetical protein DPMN_133680 [Dreissena polymorpha]|uniref:Uncharacterized protein n=2 Tax=Dreissena polymorpha TaxID=45954 RepID=A0A9D4FVT8_DREPO|nr:hypothetical protein DPMN_133680 [Dreissena polymorpha]
MYLFSVQYCVHHSKQYVYLEIVHGDKALQRSIHYDATGTVPCVTMQVSAAVAMGIWSGCAQQDRARCMQIH